jgi:hypothetical protein
LSSYESLIGKALLADSDDEKSLAMDRVMLKMFVCEVIFCTNPRCGSILDQSTSALYEIKVGVSETPHEFVICGACHDVADFSNLGYVKVTTWDKGKVTIC